MYRTVPEIGYVLTNLATFHTCQKFDR